MKFIRQFLGSNLSRPHIKFSIFFFLCRWKMIYRNAPLIFILVCGFILFIFYTADDQSPKSPPQKFHQPLRNRQLLLNNKTQLKTILYWNEFYGRYDTYDFGFGHEAFVEKNCAFSNCFATKDRNLLPSLG